MIDNLPGLRTFAQVVAAGSLSAASREMDLSLAVVSKRLTQLEKDLGLRLLQRTTRKQVLTEEGGLFYAEVARILAAIDRAETVMSGRAQAINGTIRLTAPGEFGRQWSQWISMTSFITSVMKSSGSRARSLDADFSFRGEVTMFKILLTVIANVIKSPVRNT